MRKDTAGREVVEETAAGHALTPSVVESIHDGDECGGIPAAFTSGGRTADTGRAAAAKRPPILLNQKDL